MKEVSPSLQQQSSPSDTQANRRNRLSFVCQACRRGKTKCDREKPSCSRCLKHGIECVYDVERQTPPRHPNKDATIARLKREIEYWQAKALKQTLNGEIASVGDASKTSVSPMTTNTSFTSQIKVLAYGPFRGLSDVMIDLQKFKPSLIITQNTSRDVKPSSDMAQVRQDSFLAIFFASFFAAASENTLINSISSNDGVPYAKRLNLRSDLLNLQDRMLRKCTNVVQQARVTGFSERVMQELGGSRDVRTGIFLNLLSSKMSRNLIEDLSADENVYSSALSQLVRKIELLLPPFPALMTYKAYFFSCLFPHLPFLDRSLFEEALHNVIAMDPDNPLKIKLRLGKQNLRLKIEYLAILMVMLGISYTSMKTELGLSSSMKPAHFDTMANQNLIDQHPITDETILLSQNCIAALDFMNSTTENTICCLLYLWAFYAFSPEEGDFYYGQPTEFVLGMTSILATNIGLHRDPSQFRQFQGDSIVDKRVVNYRRILWIGLSTILNSESALKGRCPRFIKDSIYSSNLDFSSSTFMNQMVRDTVGPEEIYKKLYSEAFTKHRTYDLLSRFEKIWSSSDGEVALSGIETLVKEVEQHIQKLVGLLDLKYGRRPPYTNLAAKSEHEIHAGFAKASERASNFQAYIIAQLILTRTSFSIFIYFEMKCKESYQEFCLFYEAFFVDVVQRFLKLSEVYCQYYNGELAENFLPSSAFVIDKAMQMSMGTIFYTAVAVMLRLTHAIDLLQDKLSREKYLHEKGAENQMYEVTKRLEVLNAINNRFEIVFDRLCHLSTNHLRLTFFSAFKMLLFFDHILQLVKRKEMTRTMRELAQLDLTEKTKKNLFLGFGFDVKKTSEMFNDLRSTVSLSMMSFNVLYDIQHSIDRIPVFQIPADGKNAANSSHRETVPNGLLPFNSGSQHTSATQLPSLAQLPRNFVSADGMHLPLNSELDFNHIELFDFDFDFLLGGM
ncbi:LAME_0B00716g1_1 [Lachancea meyersii CBS 8951]|uniref:LAME_0B00716g1_1 n=1 Tax=Lachancea meyersii CBS 8951 TaxID=1266667 RepID=A0A1G4IT00_9SACH|nr:LAME_0B00716g1_1 [Lachancea meyersii CBS 8951]